MTVETIRERLEDHWWTFEAFAHLVLEELQIFGQGLLYVVFLIMSFCADRHLQLQKDQMAYHAGMNEIDGLHHLDRDKNFIEYGHLQTEYDGLSIKVDRCKTKMALAMDAGDADSFEYWSALLEDSQIRRELTEYKLCSMEHTLALHSQTPGYKPYVDEV